MTDETPKPKRKRWRWIIAGVLLFVSTVSGWWLWPRGDAAGFPILDFTSDQGPDVLLRYRPTEAEKQLFQKMDAAVVALAGEPDLDRCYEAIIPIGMAAGLDESHSIAFWTRITFREFEP